MPGSRNAGVAAESRPLVVAFGEALWDLLPDGPALGGAPLNFAYRCVTLGMRGVLVSRVGTDRLGDDSVGRMERLGMDTRFIQRDPRRPTGTVVVRLDARGTPDFSIVDDVAYDYIEPADGLAALVAGADCLCFGTLAQRSPVSRRTIDRLLEAFAGRFLVLDANLRRDCYTAETIRLSVARAKVLKMNEAEAPEVAAACGLVSGSLPDVSRGLLAGGGLDLCVVTLGERGCFAMARNGEAVYEPAFGVRLRDTCGSGDAFTAAFVREVMRGQGLRAACRVGNALGALVAAQSGATEPIAEDELHAFAANGPRLPPEERLLAFAAHE